MQTRTLRFVRQRDTKNTVRYEEDPTHGNPVVIGTLYVQRTALGEPVPEELTITIGRQEEGVS